MTNLAIIDINMERYDSAKKKLLEAYNQSTKLKGNNNPELVIKLKNLAIIDIFEKNFEQALDRLQKALWIEEKYYGQHTIKYVEVLV
jgi:tetratricopeptide (TPR) repeat protein